MSLVCLRLYGATSNLFEENKVVFNERKEAAKQAIYPEVKFIK